MDWNIHIIVSVMHAKQGQPHTFNAQQRSQSAGDCNETSGKSRVSERSSVFNTNSYLVFFKLLKRPVELISVEKVRIQYKKHNQLHKSLKN